MVWCDGGGDDGGDGGDGHKGGDDALFVASVGKCLVSPLDSLCFGAPCLFVCVVCNTGLVCNVLTLNLCCILGFLM